MDENSSEAGQNAGKRQVIQELDPQNIMAEIQDRIEIQRQKANLDSQDVPEYAGVSFPGKPVDIPYDLALYQHLEEVNSIYQPIGVDLDPRESKISRIPILGRFWRAFQQGIHGTALLYANQVAEKQAGVNAEFVAVLNRLVIIQQKQERLIRALEDEIAEIRREGII